MVVTERATRREWIGLAVLALPCMVYAMDLTVLNLAIPAISAEFKPSSSQLLWMIDIYGFMVAGFLITMGTLGDRIGRRRLLLIGAAAFAIASIVAAFSNSATMLIAMRALLGIAGATVAPSTMSLLRNMFHDEKQRQFAIGVWIASFSAGGILGPLVGGGLLHYFSWGSVFLAAVPVMLLLVVVGPILLPEYRDPNAGRIDLISVALSLLAVLFFIYGVKHLAEFGPSLVSAVAVTSGIVLGTLFARRQSRIDYPLLDMKLFRIRKFAAAITAYGLSCFAMFGLYIFITQYLQLVLGLSALVAGIATMPWAIAFMLGSMSTARLTARFAPALVLVSGLVFAMLGFLLIFMIDNRFALWLLLLGTVVMALGMAPVFTIANEMMITSAPPQRAGAASALAETGSELGGALGIALCGSLGTAIYRAKLAATIPPQLSELDRAAAIATLAGALTNNAQLPAEVVEALILAARSAFVSAFQGTALLGAAIMALAALGCARLFTRP
jgi:MFS transporter, DHA2 family, multidrug resistance protein